MTQATGALSKLVMGFESAFGTIATDGFRLPFVSSTLKSNRNKIPSKVIRGDFNPGKPSGGNYTVPGTIVVPVCSISFWYWMKLAFNTMSKTVVATMTPLLNTAHWSASGSGTNEFYYTGTLAAEPAYVELNSVAATKGTLGSLAAGTWGWGDNDTLGANKMYVRLADGADPDSKTSGWVATAAAITGYAHKFSMTGATPRVSATIEHQFLDLDTVKYFQYTGIKVSAISFSVGQEGELLATLTLTGAKRNIATSPFDASPTEVGYSPLDNSQASIEEGGSELGNSTGVSCDINFGLDSPKYFIGGGGYPGSIPDGIIGVSGNLDFIFEDTTLMEKAIASTESSVKNIFSASASSKVEVFAPEVEFGENDPEISGPQGIMVNLPYEGFYDNNAAASAIVVTVTNTEAHA